MVQTLTFWEIYIQDEATEWAFHAKQNILQTEKFEVNKYLLQFHAAKVNLPLI